MHLHGRGVSFSILGHHSISTSRRSLLLRCLQAHQVRTISYASSRTDDVPRSKQHQQQRVAPPRPQPPLSILPLSYLLRSYLISSVLSSSVLLRPSLWVTSQLAHSRSALLNPDRNLLLRWCLKNTFYKQFCAGENAQEVRQTADSLKQLGFRGVILAYAREVVMAPEEIKAVNDYESTARAAAQTKLEIDAWKRGTLETVQMSVEGDFVAVKFSGAGSEALQHLTHNEAPAEALEAAITEVCDLATSRGVCLLFDAEQQAVQAGIDAWALDFMRRYNRNPALRPVVFNTYQGYLKVTPSILAHHLNVAQREGFSLGVKLVRGAYLASDPRHIINDTKEQTDENYDGMTEALISGAYNNVLKQEGMSSAFPSLSVVLASHNAESVRKARTLHASLAQSQGKDHQIDLVYAQLMGMADEVSCELVQAHHLESAEPAPDAYKYLVWGSTGECMKYLLRRAEENRDAVGRTRLGRIALGRELRRRIGIHS